MLIYCLSLNFFDRIRLYSVLVVLSRSVIGLLKFLVKWIVSFNLFSTYMRLDFITSRTTVSGSWICLTKVWNLNWEYFPSKSISRIR